MATSAPARFCTSCGESIQPANNFCTGCGTPATTLPELDEISSGRTVDELAEVGDPSGPDCTAGAAESSRSGAAETPEQIDLFRYHDLTKRLAAFSTDGGQHLRGDSEDLEISDAEPLYEAGEEEIARIAGVTELIGPRSIPGVNADPSLGLVAKGAGMLILTNRRAIVMFQHPGTTQLGQLDGNEVHTFVLPWDLVDSISMPARKSLTDRIAGARTIEIYVLTVGSVLKIMPIARERDGQTAKLREEDAMALLARTAVTHRLSVSPQSEHARLRGLLDGSFPVSDGEFVANITDEETSGVPAHLVGRLVERE